MSVNPMIPGVVRRPLHVIFLVDVSGSMAHDQRIGSLNAAMEATIRHLAEVESGTPGNEIFVRVVRFGDRAEWHVAEPTPVSKFRWQRLEAHGLTAMGGALELAAAALTSLAHVRQSRPLVVLVTDGQPTDDFQRGLQRFDACPLAGEVRRLAIAIGEGVDRSCLRQFVRGAEGAVLSANSAAEIVEQIEFGTITRVQRDSPPAAVPAVPPPPAATPAFPAVPPPPVPAPPPAPVADVEDDWIVPSQAASPAPRLPVAPPPVAPPPPAPGKPDDDGWNLE